MESQGANLLPSSAPLLELIVRLVGVHDVQADSVGALDGGVHRHSLGNDAQGGSVQSPGLVPIVHTMETRGAGTRVGGHARSAVSSLAWLPATIVEVGGRKLFKKFS